VHQRAELVQRIELLRGRVPVAPGTLDLGDAIAQQGAKSRRALAAGLDRAHGVLPPCPAQA
jgi:hypothetical protein